MRNSRAESGGCMSMQNVYEQKMNRYLTALRNEKPDRVPVRPFVAEAIVNCSGYTCQEVTHDYNKAFDATCQLAAELDCDAIVPNMVYVWTGLTEAMGLRYYAVPGIDIPSNTGFQYLEPAEEDAFMKADEYDVLIEDPTGFLYNIWFPRVSKYVSPAGQPTTYQNNLAFVRGAMAMMEYFAAFGPQLERLKKESGTVSAIAGILKSPFEIIADKLRGYIGLTLDMETQPEKVLEACEALAPHLCNIALATADPEKRLPIGHWMHRGCVPFVRMDQFKSHHWPTLKPIIEELWSNGYQTLFYAEGNWNAHLESFKELPDLSIVYHVDRDDIFDVHRKMGDKFCLSGGIPNFILGYRSPEEVRSFVKKVIQEVAQDGGYILDASAIMQNDTRVENLKAMAETAREYGVSSTGHSVSQQTAAEISPDPRQSCDGKFGLERLPRPRNEPNVCVPWETKMKERSKMTGDEGLCRTVWENTDANANMFIWQCLLSF
jgi:uroporphyrinogen-III decarboxylase